MDPQFPFISHEVYKSYTGVRWLWQNDYTNDMARMEMEGRIRSSSRFGGVMAIPCDCDAVEDVGTCFENSKCDNVINGFECPSNGRCRTKCMNRVLSSKAFNDTHVEIRAVPEREFGLFAKQDLMSQMNLFEACGVLEIGQSLHDDYCFEIAENVKPDTGNADILFLNTKHASNQTRYLNTGCVNNCTIVKRVVGFEARAYVKTTRNIQKGEELYLPYLPEFLKGMKCTIPGCNNPECPIRKANADNKTNGTNGNSSSDGPESKRKKFDKGGV